MTACGAPSRLCCWVWEPYRDGLCHPSPHPRGWAWGQVGGDRGAPGARAGGSSFPLSSDSAQSWPSRSQRHRGPNEVAGRCLVPSHTVSGGGSGLAVALVDVVLHQSHHLLKLVLQLGPPGDGVCLQGCHDLRGSRGAVGLQAWAPVGPGAGFCGVHPAWISTAADPP